MTRHPGLAPRAAACAAAVFAAQALAADEAPRLQVASAFVEMHTFPGRNFPVHHVAARHEWLTLEMSRTGWIRVRTERGVVGWVARADLGESFAAAGWRDDDAPGLFRGRVEMTAAAGRFAAEPLLKFRAGWRFADAFGAEVALGHVQGLFAGSDFWQLGLAAEPWAAARWSPQLAVGLGRFANLPNASLVGAAPTRSTLGHAGIGLRWRLAPRVVVRADWTLYTAFVSDSRSVEYRAATLGLGFTF